MTNKDQTEEVPITKEEMALRFAVLKGIGAKRVIDEASVVAAVGLEDRQQSMKALKGLGFALNDIGTYYGKADGAMSRERVRQIVGQSNRAKPVVRETETEEVLARQIWKEANEDLTWWGTNGRLDNTRIVALYLKHQFTWDRARELSRSKDSSSDAFYAGCSKVDVILRTTFKIEPTHDAKVAWFADKIENHTKAGIFEILNKGQSLTVPEYTFLRIWRELGLNVKVRKIKKHG